MSSSGAISARMQRAPSLGLAHASALIQVTWDQSPELEQFLGFISAYARARFSASLAERVALASTELLDNAVRYGSLARDFSYRLELEEKLVCVFASATRRCALASRC